MDEVDFATLNQTVMSPFYPFLFFSSPSTSLLLLVSLVCGHFVGLSELE